MRKALLITLVLLVQTLLLFGQNPDASTSYFWDDQAVNRFLSHPIFVTFLLVGCGVALVLTLCSLVAEKYLERHALEKETGQGNPTADAQMTHFAKEPPKPACRVLLHFVNLLPPVKS